MHIYMYMPILRFKTSVHNIYFRRVCIYFGSISTGTAGAAADAGRGLRLAASASVDNKHTSLCDPVSCCCLFTSLSSARVTTLCPPTPLAYKVIFAR